VETLLPIAAATGDGSLMIPTWGCILLVGIGAVYLVLGTRWARLFNVLSMTFLGCVGGLVVSQWVPLAQPVVIVIVGVLLGGLAAVFRGVAHAVLGSVVLAAVLSVLVGLIVGDEGFTVYLVVNLSEQWSAPNLAHDAVLAGFMTGLLTGAAVALGHRRLSRRLVASAQGAGAILFGVTELVGAWGTDGGSSLAADYPLTLTAAWACLVVIGMQVQQVVERTFEELGAVTAPEGDEAE